MSVLDIPALGPAGLYRTRKRTTVVDARGVPALELTVVPGLVAADWTDQVRRGVPLPAGETADVLAKAADVFEHQDILGLDLARHEQRVSELTGTPIAVVRDCDRLITATLRDVMRMPAAARPAGCVPVRTPAVGVVSAGAAWCRLGDVFTVQAAGNSPGVHALWLEALALGYRVVVRPSQRDPLTPLRLVLALRRAGLPEHQVIVVPCDHTTADLLVERADRAVVYGGQAVVNKYCDRSDVRTQGPGRSKLVVAADADRDTGLRLALTGVLYHAGTACTATTGILVEHDAAGFAESLAAMLAEVRPAPPTNDAALLPCMPRAEAEYLAAAVLDRAVHAGATVHLAPRVEPLGEEHLAALTPSVVELSSARDPLLALEMPFPCVWVAPFERGAVDALADSLVLSLHTEDPGRLDQCLDLTSVSNLYQSLPTSWTGPEVPHDDFLGQFLMRAKGLAHAVQADEKRSDT